VREVSADEILLFRYSALIFNAHRIHWDRPYACEAEGYAGLVVHGQLIATWLADLVRRHDARAPRSFRFRSFRPLLEHERCRLCGVPHAQGVKLWAEDGNGAVVMEAFAELG
jgi:3-methylfumaryl-CoA hydratase